ncbi:hypothetical protein ACVIQT_004406 [Bradyrhizobium diazoefficiens]
MSFLNTVTVFGTATDITLAELALEMLFPADNRTIELANLMQSELVDQASPVAVERGRAGAREHVLMRR